MNISDLKQKLIAAGVDVSLWRHEESRKEIGDLFQEVKSGESEMVFCENRALRRIQILKIEIFAEMSGGVFRLQESQFFHKSGELKIRPGSTISEKIKPKEDLKSCLIRAIGEELNEKMIDENIIEIDQESYFETRKSQAYFGLETEYEIFTAKVQFFNEQIKSSYEENQPEKGKTNIFDWKKV